MRRLRVATCNLNQLSIDFESNLKNIKESIRRAKAAGAVIRLGSELEITGYGCEDSFLDLDTIVHAWECLKDILQGDLTDGILCSIGMPVMKDSVRYNCQVFCMNREILMIRPKTCLPNDGNYRECRWFSAWKIENHLVTFKLPTLIADALPQKTVPFGYGLIEFADAIIAGEICEELFSPESPHSELALNGVEVFMNASGSHHQLRKLNHCISAFTDATRTCGGVYMYSNQQGCDGGRLYYDGCCCVVVNGAMVAQGSQFSMNDVEVAVAQVDLDEVVSFRGSCNSFQQQASSRQTSVRRVESPHKLCRAFDREPISRLLKIKYHLPEEEIALGPACWLWDYLRRSGASGFLLPLSGGADSSAVAAIVGYMCKRVVEEIENGNDQAKKDAIRIGQYPDGEFPTDRKEFAKRIFYTVYIGTENSSKATRSRAKSLADEIGSWHLDVCIDSVISALLTLFQTLTGKRPRYKVDGGSTAENLGLQNVQARIRMVLAYMLAALMPWVHNKPNNHLVLGSSNVDEALRGYFTKYDCSAADLNPIGSISKTDLRTFLRWAAVDLDCPSLAEVEAAPPTAELEPRSSNYVQLDEVDMRMTYEELSVYGVLRKKFRCGPVKMFESYSPDDNRFDLRQCLYNTLWPYQFRKIDELVENMGCDKDIL